VGGHFVTVSASCGITQSGAVECWKADLVVPPPGQYDAVADNGWDACATRAEGGVACWGRAPWPYVPSAPRFTAVSTVGSLTGYPDSEGINACGLTEHGDIDCWGDGSPHWNGKLHFDGPFLSMQLGSGRLAALRPSGELVYFTGADGRYIRSFRDTCQLFTVNGSGCQLFVSGKLECQGRFVESPPADLVDVKHLRSGSRHACALQSDGEIRCWGDARPPPKLKFSYISQPDRWDSYCGITLDGDTYCWGNQSPGPAPRTAN
jgi:hypothetical protein